MPRKGHTEEPMLHTLRQAEGGEKVAEICRKRGISEQTCSTGKRKYAGMGLSEWRQLREEHATLTRRGADRSLDRHVLQEIVRNKR